MINTLKEEFYFYVRPDSNKQWDGFVVIHLNLLRSVSLASTPLCICWGGGGRDLVSTVPGCVCPKEKDIGPFSASSE